MNWDTHFAARTAQMKRSTVREILKLTAQPDMISFAGGLPAPELFPVERIAAATEVVLAERGREALQYSTTEGLYELREWVARRLSTPKLTITPANVLMVSGSQQGIDLFGRVLLDERSRVIVENPTYVGMLSAWKPYHLDFAAAPTDADGLRVEAVAALLRDPARAMYVIPNFQNPQGVTLGGERRAALADLLARHNLPCYEDDPYGELRYSGEALPALLHYEAAARGTNTVEGSVIYAGTMSKILTPGLRVGWVIAAEAVIDKMVQAKQATDLHTGTLNQFISYEMVRDEAFLAAHIAELRHVYKERRDLMLRLLDAHFPAEARWTRPDGGLFIMVTLPDGLDATEVLKQAVEHKVAFVPGADFFIGDGGRNTFRLNFSNARPERIEAGITRLGALLKAAVVQ